MISTLIVDDSKTELDVILFLIKKNNLPLEAAVASNGEEALQYIEKKTIDLLITDIRMPFMDGLTLCKEALKINSKMKIILSSGYQDFSYAKTAITLGVEEYLLKPIHPLEFTELIQKVSAEIEEEKNVSQNNKSILLLLSTDASHDSYLSNLNTEICKLAKQVFQIEPRCTQIDSYILLTMDDNTFFDEQDEKEFEKLTEVLLEKIRNMYLIPIQGVCSFMATPECLLEIIHKLKKNISLLNLENEDTKTEKGIPDSANGKVKYICEYIASHYQENLGLELLANIMYLNPDYLSRIFKKETGMNLNYYIKVFRLNQACRLLETTQQKITTISTSVGYQNCAYFIRSFTDYFGTSPEKYRQQHSSNS